MSQDPASRPSAAQNVAPVSQKSDPQSADGAPVAHGMSRLRLRLYFADGLMLGPGKADLLAGIAESGSISAAGRAMGMSYKRAWSLVEEMNAAFAGPLVASARGGAGGGGAGLTALGHEVLGLYRALVARTLVAGAEEIAALEALRRLAPPQA